MSTVKKIMTSASALLAVLVGAVLASPAASAATSTIVALEPVAPPGSDKVVMIIGWVMWLSAAGLLCGFIGCGCWFGIEKFTSGSTRTAGIAAAACCAGAVFLVAVSSIFTAITGWTIA